MQSIFGLTGIIVVSPKIKPGHNSANSGDPIRNSGIPGTVYLLKDILESEKENKKLKEGQFRGQYIYLEPGCRAPLSHRMTF